MNQEPTVARHLAKTLRVTLLEEAFRKLARADGERASFLKSLAAHRERRQAAGEHFKARADGSLAPHIDLVVDVERELASNLRAVASVLATQMLGMNLAVRLLRAAAGKEEWPLETRLASNPTSFGDDLRILLVDLEARAIDLEMVTRTHARQLHGHGEHLRETTDTVADDLTGLGDVYWQVADKAYREVHAIQEARHGLMAVGLVTGQGPGSPDE